jgi:hypothetical protein
MLQFNPTDNKIILYRWPNLGLGSEIPTGAPVILYIPRYVLVFQFP